MSERATTSSTRTIYNPDGTAGSAQTYQGSPTWDTLYNDVQFFPTITQWSTLPDNQVDEQVGGRATVTIDGTSCQAPIADASPGTGNLLAIRATSSGDMELIMSGAYEYASPHSSNCQFDMGPLNPGGTLTPSTPDGFDATEAAQVHIIIPKAQLDAISPGQSVKFPVGGPASLLTLSADCGSSSDVSCKRSISWQGNVYVQRTTS
jgi:hypothetical protein